MARRNPQPQPDPDSGESPKEIADKWAGHLRFELRALTKRNRAANDTILPTDIRSFARYITAAENFSLIRILAAIAADPEQPTSDRLRSAELILKTGVGAKHYVLLEAPATVEALMVVALQFIPEEFKHEFVRQFANACEMLVDGLIPTPEHDGEAGDA